MSDDQRKEFLQFWFSKSTKDRWFNASPQFDAELRDRYESLWQAAADQRLDEWESVAAGALALVIVLDQLPLNIFRGKPESFATEAASRAIAGRALARGFEEGMTDNEKFFLFMPYMHSEDLADQDRSVALFEGAGFDPKWAKHHRAIVQQFGRFPHRNVILGRDSSDDEVRWLQSEDGFSG